MDQTGHHNKYCHFTHLSDLRYAIMKKYPTEISLGIFSEIPAVENYVVFRFQSIFCILLLHLTRDFGPILAEKKII
jgi:hypothetical protein